jgi:hypothetical protein
MTEALLNQNVDEEQKKIHITIRINKDEISLKKCGSFDIVRIDEGSPKGTAGEPALSWRKYYVAIPWDAVPKELQINDISIAPLARNIFVEPYQPNVPDKGRMVEWIRPDPKIYESDAIFPRCFARIAGTRRIGGFAMAELDVCPFRYYPHSKKLKLIERMDLSLTYTQTGIQSEKILSLMTLRYERKSEARVKKLVLNPEHVLRFRSSESASASLSDLGINLPTVDYVIITSKLLADEFNRLAKWRTIMGLRARVVTIEEIQSNSVPDTDDGNGEYPKFKVDGVYNDGGTRDLQEIIRNFIKWANVHWFSDNNPCLDNNLGYVLLGGDVEIIPSRKGLYLGDEKDGRYRYAISYSKLTQPDTNAPNVAYRLDETTTRIYLKNRKDEWFDFNDKDKFIMVKNGVIIKYDENANASTLGWHFVLDLINGGSTEDRTDFIEIRGPAQNHGLYDQDKSYFLVQDDTNYVETDLYYSDISVVQYPPTGKHDWDADENGIYGEVYFIPDEGKFSGWDEVNGFSDIHVGRAPVKTPEEAKVFIDKIIRYETYEYDPDFGITFPPDFAVSVLLGSSNLGAIGEDPDCPLLDSSAIANEEIRSQLLKIDSSRWIFTRLYEGHEYVESKDKGPDLAEVSSDEMVKALKKGQNAVNIICHGGPDGFSWILLRNHIKGIENIPGIIFGCSCSTARFDFEDQDGASFGECAILEPKGGAVAYIGATRMSCCGDWPITVAFWAKWPECERIAEMFDASALKYCDNTGTIGPNYLWNLLGDPAMRVWSDRPQQMNVSHPSEVCTGYQTFEANVTCNGDPVENALVCLTMVGDPVTKQGALFATTKTDKSGNAYRTITPSAEGKMIITVSAKNMKPYLSQITIKKCGEKLCKASLTSCGPQIGFGCIYAVVTCSGSLSLMDTYGHGCPGIDPMDINWEEIYEHWIDTIKKPEYLYAIWGIRDLGEFIKRADTPEIKETLEKMPVGFRKPIAQMIKRIKDEKEL